MSPEGIIVILIISIPIFFICKWAMGKLGIGEKNKRIFLAILPTLVLSPLLYLGVVVAYFSSTYYYPKEKFDQERWTTNIEERYRMSEDIIESKILIGKSKEAVIQLLGEDFKAYDPNHMYYYLGFVPGFILIDPDVLDIYFENGKVIKVSQHTT